MKKIFVLILVVMLVFAGCVKDTDTASDKASQEPNKDNSQSTPQQDTPKPIERKPFKTVYNTELATINYLTASLSTVNEFTYTTVDGLIDFDKYGVLKPNLAVSYEVSNDGLVYTFKLREGVKWYTHEGKEYADVTADDFVYGMKYVLNKDNASTTSNIVYNVIKNAKEYYEGTITDFSQVGIKALDKYTLQYTLIEPVPYFVKMTSYTCWLPANEKFITEVGADLFGTSNDTMLYNGAYILTLWEHENKRIRTLNENYWDKDNIFVSTIENIYNKEAATIQADLFLRGEVSEAAIPVVVQDEWMNDPAKKVLLSRVPLTAYSWQYIFNFEPLYEKEYGPDNWLKAVNNLNFRKSIYHAIDRKVITMALEPYASDSITASTVILTGMFDINGQDYTALDPLKDYAANTSFNKDTALEFKQKAMEELKGKVEFPVKLVYPHTTTQAVVDRSVIFEQHLETVLGPDFIDVILVPYPPTDFNSKSRGEGRFSLMPLGWGPDFADPASCFEIYTSDSSIGPKYGRTFMCEGSDGENGKKVFENLIDKAKAEKFDIAKRSLLFAEAEKYILDNAFSIPCYRTGGGFQATYKDPFSANCTQFGRNNLKLKGVKILDKPMNFEEYDKALAQWEKERQEALKNPDSYWK